MARWTRRRTYGRRRRATRGRRRGYGKRRSYRRLRSRRPVTRRVLQRALRPLRPEWKHYDIRNENDLYIGETIDDITVNSFHSGDGNLNLYEGATASQPFLLTHIPEQGTATWQRIGRQVTFKRIEIRFKLEAVTTTVLSTLRVRIMVLRTGDLPQNAYGYTNTTYQGNAWPTLYQDATGAAIDSPCCWLYDNALIDAFPSVHAGPRSKMLRIAARRRITLAPQYNSNPAVGTVFYTPDPTKAPSRAGHIVVRPKAPTWFNDTDTSKVNGYAQKNHFWLFFHAEDGATRIKIPQSNLNIRVWYTDA